MNIREMIDKKNEMLIALRKEANFLALDLVKEMNEQVDGDWSAEVYDDETNLYILFTPAEIPEEVEYQGYISIDIMPFLSLDALIGVSKSDIEFLKDNKNLLKNEKVVDYYEIMYKGMEYLSKVVRESEEA